MTFFVTSTGPARAPTSAGSPAPTRTARAGASRRRGRQDLARLSVDARRGAVNARDRIGKGPWSNAKGVVVAKDVADLHSANNNLTKQTALSEKGEVINGRGDTPNRHDILTGSQPDGTAFPARRTIPARTGRAARRARRCSAMLTARDCDDDAAVQVVELVASFARPDGGARRTACSSTGGDGLLYCFAVN